MLKLKDFFGLRIDEDISDIQSILAKLGIESFIKETKVVQSLIKANGRDAAIVTVATRQQVLKYLKPMLNDDLLDYEESFYTKEVTTASEHDRRYDSEDKLLAFALQVASTKSQNSMLEDSKILTVKQLREAAFRESRFDRCWDILSLESNHIVSAYRKSRKSLF